MRKTFVFAALAAAALALGASASYGANVETVRSAQNRPPCGTGGPLQIVGLTADQRLICFTQRDADEARTIGSVSNLQVDTSLVGIDYRPADGNLYGVGNQGGVYTVDVTTAQATLVSRTNVALNGTSFGTDFNPAADRFRIVSDTGQNLRVNVADGTTTTDGPLNYTAGTPAAGVTGAAYTNNDADPNTGTTLFDFDSVLDQVAVQSPPNNGSLVATGKFGVDSGPEIGADIYSVVRQGTTVENHAFASVRSGSTSWFTEVDLLTGRVTNRDQFSAGDTVIGLTVPLNQR